MDCQTGKVRAFTTDIFSENSERKILTLPSNVYYHAGAVTTTTIIIII
jgi:hypothetical protein